MDHLDRLQKSGRWIQLLNVMGVIVYGKLAPHCWR